MSAVLKPFAFSTTSSFVLEFGEQYVGFFTNGQRVTNASGDAYTIASPYAEADCLNLQLEQVGDIVRITHPDYPPYKLSRLADDDWTLEAIDFDEPPFLDENLDDSLTITPSGTTVGSSITLTASSGLIFQDGHVGSYWKIGHRRDASNIEFAIDSDGNSSTLKVFGKYNVRTYGNWGGDLLVQRSLDGGTTWETVAKFHAFINSDGVGSRSVDAEAEAETDALYRLRMENFESATADAKAVLENFDQIVYGFVKITAVATDGGSATATVKSELEATTATELWSEGAWSGVRGYPRAIATHESRMYYGGTAHQPSTIWGSVVDDLDNFATGDASDSDALSFTLAGRQLNAINWLASQTVLLVGTTGGEWRVVGDLNGGIITASRVNAKQQSYYGSEYQQVATTGDAVLFLARKGKALRELSYALDSDRWVAQDLMLLAQHLTDAGRIIQTSWQADAQILWCVTEDGRLLGLTYDREQQVVGWHEHTTDGSFRSVACIYGDTDAADEVWCIVERTLASAQVFYVERFYPTPWTDKEDGFFVDSGLAYSGSPANTFAGADHLAGRSDCVALADGIVYENIAVDSGGEFSLPSGVSASTLRIGLPFTSKLSPYRIDADQQLGIHLGRNKRIAAISLRLLRSCMPKFAEENSTWQGQEPEALRTDDPDNPPLLGADEAVDVPLDFATGFDTNPIIEISQDRPLPLTVLAAMVDYQVGSGV